MATAKEEKFAEITAKMLETYRQKNHDYGDCFSTVFCELGMPYAYGHFEGKVVPREVAYAGRGESKGREYGRLVARLGQLCNTNVA